ncbi:hypothetical protein BJ138DRAFT_1120260 [Hygrophoropsis aurantiaca]|uniref:Uncharacterized protein n=1 Tax=Hygrophoropsis aurantiaca TaxID=72124 RepID=A0ACB7ZRT6_9AGAM|nr:hypothetical protein BJ138DRAFT_1120260 [Hygrophoropsis aurantiaca]
MPNNSTQTIHDTQSNSDHQSATTSSSFPETKGRRDCKGTDRSTCGPMGPTLKYPRRRSTDSDISYALSCRRAEITALLPWADAESSPEPDGYVEKNHRDGV